MPTIRVIIPAFNEEASIGKVINDIPSLVEEVIVVSNNSTDATEKVAQNHGATVLVEPKKGYGYACLKGMEYLQQKNLETDIVVFLDGDYSDYPEYLAELVSPIQQGTHDFVIGARRKNLREEGSMTFPQIFGNALATFLMKRLFGASYTDLGPFRAIHWEALLHLKMQDKTYGWTVEMQLKALTAKLRYTEIPVPYRNRIGTSKVSGTVKGAVMAGIKILGWIFAYGIRPSSIKKYMHE